MSKESGADRAFPAALKRLLDAPFRRAAWDAVASDHLHLRIGNEPTQVGRDAALRAFGDFRTRILGFGGRYCELWRRREAVYAETVVHFLTLDGRLSEIPCAIVARVVDGLLQDIRFHLDPTPIPPDGVAGSSLDRQS